MTALRLTPIFAAALLAAGAASADIVVMSNGTELAGRVEAVESKPDRIRLVRGSGTIEIPRRQIQDIVEEADSVDYRRIGLQLLDARSYERAVETFKQSLATDPEDTESKDGLRRAEAAIAERDAEARRAEQAQIDDRIVKAREAVQAERFAEAEVLLKEVASAGPNESQRTAAQLALVDLYLAWGFQRLDRLDVKGAEEKYLRVLELDPQNERARIELLEVWKDDPSKRAQVLEAYLLQLRNDPDNLELNAKVADLLTTLARYEEALGPLEKLTASPRFRSLGYDKRFRTSLREAILNQTIAGNFEPAIEGTKKLLQYFPEEDPTQLTVLQFRKAMSEADPADIDTRAALVKRLRDAGLAELAQSEAAFLARVAPDNEVLRGILREEAELRLAEVREELQARNWVVARDMSQRYVTTYTSYPDLVAVASEIYERSSVEAERAAKARREQGREIAQQGIEYYNQALAFSNQLRNTEVESGSRPYSPKQEAIKNAKRAVERFEIALQIDPSLGPVTGMDLNTRLNDARSLYNQLTQRGTALPKNRNVPNSRN
ncbi:MAG: hypothetical protein SF028_05430 [Candidatus Sumerlaeia bacterium]|nr:hypothetical protein [Candidatus Sumerlaeia bacterium]